MLLETISVSLTFVLQRLMGNFTLRALFQISVVQDFMVRGQATIPELIFKKGQGERQRERVRERFTKDVSDWH